METKNHKINAADVDSGDGKANVSRKGQTEPPRAADIEAWLVSYLAELLEIAPDALDITVPFDRYGLDSSSAVGLTCDLEDWLGCELDPTLAYDYPTIEALARHLAEQG